MAEDDTQKRKRNQDVRELLAGCDQPALLAELDSSPSIEGLAEQIEGLNASYPGGLNAYVRKAKALLKDSSTGANPMADVVAVEVPDGETLVYDDKATYGRFEALGLAEMPHAAFVLVAGGLGERLGYGDIKLSLPVDLASEETYLGTYCASILALQALSQSPTPLPLVIMTSDDTHARTVALLEANAHFGMAEGQVRLVKQDKVAALVDNSGGFALDASRQRLLTKPHGHGDVHLLLHQKGIAEEWRAAGHVRWVVFFQDTNGLVFQTMCAVLGVSKDRALDLNSMCIPRQAAQEVGAITRLVYKDGRKVTANTEYNQLGPLLRALGTEGDVADPSTGFSPYPGNINQLVVSLASYAATLGATQGVMEEFVNPKYADKETRTTFKKPTRLECMMQDYAKVLGPDARVGFTSSEQWIGYSPAKNSIAEGLAKLAAGVDPMTAATAEQDMYGSWAERLRRAGCDVGRAEAGRRTVRGIPVRLGPLLSASPFWACTQAQLASRLPCPGKVHISAQSALVLKCGPGVRVVVESLVLDGALLLDASGLPPHSTVTLRGVVVSNAGWELADLSDAEMTPPAAVAAAASAAGGEDEAGGGVSAQVASEVLRIRGYRLVKRATETVTLTTTTTATSSETQKGNNFTVTSINGGVVIKGEE